MKKYNKLLGIGNQFLSDEEYLEQKILSIYRFKSDTVCGIKDHDSVYIASSNASAKLLGFCEVKKIVGKKDEDIPCKLARDAEIFFMQDREIEQTRSTRHYLNTYEYFSGVLPLKCSKTPIINPATNNVLGVYYEGNQLLINNILQIIFDLHGNRFGYYSSLYLGNNPKQFNLTNREQEVLYCICLGFSTRKAIANLLSYIHNREIRVNTIVDEVFKGLYRKLPCKSTAQLLEFAVANKLYLHIPKQFIPLGTFEMDLCCF